MTYISNPAAVSAETLANLKTYNAVFVSETYPIQMSISSSVLTQYVNSGGNVYIFGGVDDFASTEAALLNPFLVGFGLAFDTTSYNGLVSVNVTSTHPIFKGLTGKTLGSGNGQDIHDLGTNPNASIVQFQGQHGVYAVANDTAEVPEPATWSFLLLSLILWEFFGSAIGLDNVFDYHCRSKSGLADLILRTWPGYPTVRAATESITASAILNL